MSLLKRIEQEKVEVLSEGKQASREIKKEDPMSDVKDIIHKKIIKRVDTGLLDSEDEEKRINAEIADIVEETLKEKELHLSRTERQTMIDYIIDESIGFGPISKLLLDEEISEIMVNGPDQIYVEKKGRLEL
jgi:pilus assembly protein CpaF